MYHAHSTGLVHTALYSLRSRPAFFATGLCLSLGLLLIGVPADAQDAGDTGNIQVRPLPGEDARVGELSGLFEPAPELPGGFRNIEFGLDRDRVGDLLMQDPNFNYRGDPDVQFLPLREQVVIDSAGFDFVSRGYFQFRDNALYSIILNLNRDRMDYFSMYTQLRDTYGDPDTLSPQGAVWERNDVRLALERPLSVKYLDMRVFEDLREQGQMRESDRATARRNFLEQF